VDALIEGGAAAATQKAPQPEAAKDPEMVETKPEPTGAENVEAT